MMEQLTTHNESVETQLEQENITQNPNQNEDLIQLQNQLTQYIGTLKYSHHPDDRKWVQKLIFNNHYNIESDDINLGILYNFTYLDTIIAKLLNINVKRSLQLTSSKATLKNFRNLMISNKSF
jgi:hypothetical protein